MTGATTLAKGLIRSTSYDQTHLVPQGGVRLVLLAFGQTAGTHGLVVFGQWEAADAAPGQAADQLLGFVERDCRGTARDPVASAHLGDTDERDRKQLGLWAGKEVSSAMTSGIASEISSFTRESRCCTAPSPVRSERRRSEIPASGGDELHRTPRRWQPPDPRCPQSKPRLPRRSRRADHSSGPEAPGIGRA